jgi:FtsP/CotA-like multicopper oxidase with cupredoxin domain
LIVEFNDQIPLSDDQIPNSDQIRKTPVTRKNPVTDRTHLFVSVVVPEWVRPVCHLVVGTSVYHCHLLEHEDGGMMRIIRILPGAR